MNSITVLIVYFLTSWAASFALHKDDFIANKNRIHNAHKLLLFSLPPFIVGFYFIALKPFDAGGDTYNYLFSFSHISNPLTSTFDADYGTEFLFWPIQAILKFFVDPRGWFIANFLIVTSLNYWAYKKITEGTKLTALIFSLVFLTYSIVYSGNAMRQIYAIPLGIIAFHYAYKREHLKFILFTALSICFHWSAAIMLLSPLFTRIPNRTFYYVAIPAAALIASSLILPLASVVMNIAGFSWLEIKVNAYLKGGRISHISAIWQTLNFWLCISIYFLLVFSKAIQNPSYSKITQYLLMFISLMLFAIQSADISDRYMVHFLLLVPIAISLIIYQLKAPNIFKNMVLLTTFCIMAILVYTRESLIMALGIKY